MTYPDREYSIDDGAPVELYAFECGVPQLNFYYTTGVDAVTHAGRTFVPAHARRSTIDEAPALNNPVSVTFELALETDLAKWYIGGQAPPTLEVRVWRGHDGDGEFRKKFWGITERFSMRNNVLLVQAKPYVQSLLHRKVATERFSSQCNHTLFDTRCKVSRAAHTWNTKVVAVSTDGRHITVENQHVGNGELRIGDIKINGEERVIVSNTDNVIKVRYPFTIIEIGMDVELSRGCSKTKHTCKTVFDNFDNFGGFPIMPDKNPLKEGGKTKTFERVIKNKNDPPISYSGGGSSVGFGEGGSGGGGIP